ncbi:MAG: response regulator [Chloroflexota bacterium]|nr:response regulator [Chloroflexota bacterium]
MIQIWAGVGNGTRQHGIQPGSGAGKSGERAGTRVLVVDDDPSILDTVTSILTSEGFQVMAAGGGEQALAMLASWHPTLVLLDMRMPFMDGWAVARSMRETGSKVPIIVMTAAESAERWASEIGAAGYIAKPFGLDELISCVEEHMGRERPN